MGRADLTGLTIGITADRRAEEQAELFHRRGAETLHGPTFSVSQGEDTPLLEATLEVIRRPPDFLLASTGFGMRAWLSAADSWGLRAPLLDALGQARVANRGVKAASANNSVGLKEWWRAPNERFEEVAAAVLAEPLEGRQVVLQLHGIGMPNTVARLKAAGASVVEVDAYHASLPADSAPAEALVDAVVAHRLAAVTFTTAPAVHNLFVLAARIGRDEQLRAAFNGPVVAACVGPVCAEGAAEEGITAPLVPARARLLPLVDTLTEHLRG